MLLTASRITSALLGAAALTATAVLPATAAGHGHGVPSHRSAVVLGAIQYGSPGRDDRSHRSLNAEYVTVKNTGHRTVNLRGWTLADRAGHTYRFGNFRRRGHSQVRVHTGIGHDNRRDVLQGGAMASRGECRLRAGPPPCPQPLQHAERAHQSN